MARAREELSVVYRVQDRATKTWKKAQRNVKYFVRNSKKEFNSLKRTIFSMKGMIAGIIGGAVIKNLISTYQEHETAVTNLRSALSALGHSSKDAMDDMMRFADEIASTTTAGDEMVMQMAALGANIAQLSGDDLRKAIRGAIGLQQAYGGDLLMNMRKVALARIGETGQLKEAGIVLTEGASKQERYNELLEIAAKQWDAVRASAETSSGKMTIFMGKIGDVAAEMGKKLVKFVEKEHGLRVMKIALEMVVKQLGLMDEAGQKINPIKASPFLSVLKALMFAIHWVKRGVIGLEGTWVGLNFVVKLAMRNMLESAAAVAKALGGIKEHFNRVEIDKAHREVLATTKKIKKLEKEAVGMDKIGWKWAKNRQELAVWTKVQAEAAERVKDLTFSENSALGQAAKLWKDKAKQIDESMENEIARFKTIDARMNEEINQYEAIGQQLDARMGKEQKLIDLQAKRLEMLKEEQKIRQPGDSFRGDEYWEKSPPRDFEQGKKNRGMEDMGLYSAGVLGPIQINTYDSKSFDDYFYENPDAFQRAAERAVEENGE